MLRPALVLLIVLAGAGWGAPSFAQEAPANARAALAGGAEPDTTAPWRYYPLAVGNVWEYGTERDNLLRVSIPSDSTVGGRTYFVTVTEFSDVDGGVGRPTIRLLRYDSTAHVDRQLFTSAEGTFEGAGQVLCPLDAPFGAVVSTGGTGQCSVRGGYDIPVVFGGEEPGTGLGTVKTSVKEFATFPAFVTRYAAGIGLVLGEREGAYTALRYYRVGGKERGTPRFPVSSAPTSPAYGAALTVAPNPADGAATVRLDLPAPADVRVAVYDVLGRRVATLAAGALGAGVHGLPLDASPLAPGVYVVRAEVGGGGALVRRVTVAR